MAKNGTNATPCSAHSSTSASSSRRAVRPYWFCTHTTGAIASASVRWSAATLEMPRWRIRPASRSSASAPNRSASEPSPAVERRADAQVDDVEVVEAELADVLLDLAAQLLGPGRRQPVAGRVAAGADLGGDHEVVGVGREGRVDQLVGRAQLGEVERGGVDVVDAQLDGPAEHGDRAARGRWAARAASDMSRMAPNPMRLTVRSPSVPGAGGRGGDRCGHVSSVSDGAFRVLGLATCCRLRGAVAPARTLDVWRPAR